MQNETNTEGSVVVPPKRSMVVWLMKWFGVGVVAALIFMAGLNVGNGTITLKQQNNPNGLPTKLDFSQINNVYQALKENYNGKLTEQQLIDGLKHGLAEATNDPYTEYFTANEAKTFNSKLNNTFSGIGAELGQDKDKNLIVVSPISDLPADKAGVKAQDIIATINSESTTGMSVDEAVSKIRGKAGTVVKLGIIRDKSQALNIDITRENIQVPSVTIKMLDNNIGYMRISSFSTDTSLLARKAATSFKGQNVKGIVLDLRSDPGGLLDAAVDVSSLWVPQGKLIVSERGTTGNNNSYASGGDVLNGIPTVVLIDGGSASASEITAGALHDNKVATLIGEKSYGKGVVQQLINLKDGAQLKVTIASWYRPNGQNINHKGVSPDKTVKAGADDSIGGTDAQLQAAEDFLNR